MFWKFFVVWTVILGVLLVIIFFHRKVVYYVFDIFRQYSSAKRRQLIFEIVSQAQQSVVVLHHDEINIRNFSERLSSVFTSVIIGYQLLLISYLTYKAPFKFPFKNKVPTMSLHHAFNLRGYYVWNERICGWLSAQQMWNFNQTMNQ